MSTGTKARKPTVRESISVMIQATGGRAVHINGPDHPPMPWEKPQRALKPKAWRGRLGSIGPDRTVFEDQRPVNCTVIPDGATIPLPADVRRVLDAARELLNRYGRSVCARRYRYGQPLPKFRALADAIDKHQRAEKRRKAGGR